MSGAYYNEIDPFCAEWLKRLMLFGHIAPGEIDTRSIEDVRPDDLRDFTQCHFFAGIGVWSYALRRASWPDDRAVWTGSCPCQPFSTAGKGDGFADERHLWPAWFHLIKQCRPSVVFGEQVAEAAGLTWLDLVQTDMELANYAFAALNLCGSLLGFPRRPRIFFAANTDEGSERNSRFNAETSSLCTSAPLAGRDWRNLLRVDAPRDGVDRGVRRQRAAYGNAIVAPLAEEFIRAYMTC